MGGGQQVEATVSGRCLAPHRWNADDAVLIGVREQGFTTIHPCALLVGQFHAGIQLGRPEVAQQPGDGDVQHGFIGAQRAGS